MSEPAGALPPASLIIPSRGRPELLLDTVRERHSTELGARLAAAHTIALQLGWCLFGDFLRASTGLEDLDDRTFARSIGSTVAVIFDVEGPTSS